MKNIITISCALMMVGCSSTPTNKEPVPFNNKYSHAYNIVNQTALTDNNSPLKDLTKEEIKELKKVDLVKGSAGSASMVIGALSLLTGDISGAFHMAGGAVANLSAKKHIAGASRFIVVMDLSEKNQSKKIHETIRSGIKSVLPDNFEIVKIEAIHGTFYDFIVGGKCNDPRSYAKKIKKKGFWSIEATDYSPTDTWCITGGWYSDGTIYKTPLEFFNGVTAFSNGKLTSNYGFSERSYPHGDIDFVGVLTALGKEINVENYNEVLLKISKNLPDNYFYYKTNFSKTYDKTTGKMHTLIDLQPAVYNKGVRYDFVQPEQVKN
ncbi:hypothetical protein ACPV30_18265 [Photobacterium damselae]|uniref:hypothetical protein n=1 Tax=Photobacterium damselae TaxID=38293 RepID=UPI0040697923